MTVMLILQGILNVLQNDCKIPIVEKPEIIISRRES